MLLQGISNPNLPAGPRPSDQPAPLPSIHHFTSQPIQTLIQSLFPHDTNSLLGQSSEAHIPTSSQVVSTVSPASSHSDASPMSVLNQLANFTARENPLNLPPNVSQVQPLFHPEIHALHMQDALQSVRETAPQNDYQQIFNQVVNAATRSSNDGMNKTAQSVILGNNGLQQPQVQGYPVLLQPTGPGGPLQLVPLDKGINTDILKDMVEKNGTTEIQGMFLYG